MKKLFKHLAIVLALALVIGLVPARTAEAADYSLKFKNKYLYVGAKGEKAHGVDKLGNLPQKPIKRSLKFGKGVIKGLKDGDVVTFKSADRSIARGSKKYQRVFAVGTAGNGKAGEVDVAVKVNGEEIGTMHFFVKQNAKSLSIANLPENNEFGIGDIELTLAAEPAGATDILSVVIPDTYKDIAVVKTQPTKDDPFKAVITTKAIGSFKLQAVAQQNDSSLQGYHVKGEELDCKVVLNVEKFGQKSASEVKFDFDSDVSELGLKPSDFKVTYQLSGSTVDVSVKGVRVDADDPSIVYVSIYDENYNDGTTFKPGVEYTVTSKDGREYKFVGADLSPQFADHIVVNNLTVVYGELVDIDYAVVNAEGIELDKEALSYVTFETASTDCAINNNDKNIIFYEANKQANVTAKFDAWYKDADGKYVEKTFANTFLFKSVDRTAVKYASGEFTIGNDDLDDPIHFVAVNDTDLNMNTDFIFEAIYSDDSRISNDAGNHGDFTYKSADTNKLVITALGKVQPIAVGSTQILVYDATTASAPLIYVAQVEIKPAAKPTTIETVADKTKLNTTVGANFIDEITVVSTVKDQYGRLFDNADIEYAQTHHSKTAEFEAFAPVWVGDGEYVQVIGANALTLQGRVGDIIFSTKATDGTSYTNVSNFSISCKPAENFDNAVDHYEDAYATSAASFKLLTIVDIDTTIDDDDSQAINDFFTEVKDAPYDADGYQIGNSFDAKLEDDDIATNGTFYKYELFRGATEYPIDGDGVVRPDKYDVDIVNDGIINGVYSLTTAANEALKLPVGDYTVRLYKIVVNGTTHKKTLADWKTFSIEDHQKKLTWTKTTDSIEAAANGLKEYKLLSTLGLADAFTVKYDGNPADDARTDFFVTGGQQSAYIRDVRYAVNMAGANVFYITVEVKKTLGYK